MCTTILQSIFNIALFVCVLFTLVSLWAPGWKSVIQDGNSTKTASEGLLTVECSRGILETLRDEVADSGKDLTDGCKVHWDVSFASIPIMFQWDQILPTYQKAVIALLIISLIGSAACFVLSCLTTFLCCLCCLKAYLLYPIPIVLAVAGAFNFIACAVYGSKHSAFDEMFTGIDLDNVHDGVKEKFGYCFVLAILAGLGFITCSIIMCCLIKMNKVLPV